MIPLFKVHMPESVNEPLLATLHSGYIGQGKKVDEFEKMFEEFVGASYAVSVNSCTSALTLALRLAGVGHKNFADQDTVIVSPMTCTATSLPILSLDARPVFCDVDPRTGLVRPQDVVPYITSHTKAILLVDWGGDVIDVQQFYDDERFQAAQKAYDIDIKIIVDAAHALGGQYPDGAMEGSRADFTCFSFQAIKHITTGDGGMLMCRSKVDYEKAKLLRWYGIQREGIFTDSRIDQDIEDWGYKFHMNDVAATIGIVQMSYINGIVNQQRANALLYNQYLDDFYLKPPHVERSANWLYTLLLPNSHIRDEFQRFMASKDIMVSQVHKRNDDYKIFRPYSVQWPPIEGVHLRRSFPGLDYFTERMICIPVHWGLTAPELEHIINSCNEFIAL